MGTGKSEVGKHVAKQLGRKFIDTDDLIEREEGMPIAQIFSQKGEPYFRELEKQMVIRVCAEGNAVIATGGGTIMNEENANRLKASGTVICLTATPEIILKRVRRDATRPLLQGGEPLTKIQTLLAARAETYARADVTIDTSRLNVNEVVQAVLTVAEKEQSGKHILSI